MSSNLKVNTILPSTGTNVAIGTAGGSITMVGNVDIDINSGISTFNDIHISDKIVHDGDTNTSLRFPAADTITAETGGTERLRIASTGELLIGTTTAGESGADDLTIENTAADMGITLRTGTARNASIFFSDATSGTAQYAGYIQYLHNGDALLFGTASTERLRIKSDGAFSLTSENTTGWLLKAGQDSASYSAIDGHFPTTNRTLYLNQETTHRSFVVWNKNGSDGYGFGLDNSGNFKVVYGTSERLRIKSDGFVGINETNPSRHLHVNSGTSDIVAIFESSDTSAQIQIKDGTGTCTIECLNDFRFQNSTAEILRLKSDKDVQIMDGNLVVASGHGIDFAATSNGTGSNQNELLDDYEEGDWQPKVSAGGANWSTTCRYTKIGRMVHIHGDITNQSGSGTTEIHNLPFSVDSKYGVWKIGYYAVGGTTTGANSNHEGGIIHFQGSGYLRARISGGTSSVTMSNNDRVIFHGTYYTST